VGLPLDIGRVGGHISLAVPRQEFAQSSRKLGIAKGIPERFGGGW